VDKAVEPICGDDASKWQKNYVDKLHQPVLNYIGCSTSGRQDTYSSHAVSSLQPAIKPYLFIYVIISVPLLVCVTFNVLLTPYSVS